MIHVFHRKLIELSEEEALKLVEKVIINGREGYFCIKSSEDLTLQQALQTYRKKDSIEKIFNSMKNEIEVKRCGGTPNRSRAAGHDCAVAL